ncbi:MAG: glycosyltransferase family 2 protein [Pseudomonadota bacterium]
MTKTIPWEAGLTSWAIATTCKDSVEVVLSFVAHHLEAGASEIFLYFDDPDDPAFEWLAGHPRVHAARCDAKHWGRFPQGRPDRHQRRQGLNASLAKAATICEWLGHIDIDEYLHGEIAVGDLLGSVDAETEAVRILPVERIFTSLPPRDGISFAGGFKRRMHRRLATRIFGEEGAFLAKGFQGHPVGKTFLRTSSDARLTIHSARARGREVAVHEESARLHLLHFFPFGYDAWCEKFSRRLTVPGTMEGLPTLEQAKFRLYGRAAAEGEEALWSLFLHLCYFPPERLALLRRRGRYYDPKLDFRAAPARVFGPDAPLPPKETPVSSEVEPPRGWLRKILPGSPS